MDRNLRDVGICSVLTCNTGRGETPLSDNNINNIRAFAKQGRHIVIIPSPSGGMVSSSGSWANLNDKNRLGYSCELFVPSVLELTRSYVQLLNRMQIQVPGLTFSVCTVRTNYSTKDTHQIYLVTELGYGTANYVTEEINIGGINTTMGVIPFRYRTLLQSLKDVKDWSSPSNGYTFKCTDVNKAAEVALAPLSAIAPDPRPKFHLAASLLCLP